MSDHRAPKQRRRNALLALIIAGGIALGLGVIGLISGLVTAIILLAQLTSDLIHGY